MRAIRVVSAMVLTTMGLVATTAVPATACSCASFTTEQALRRADVVATGVLVDVRQPPAAQVRSSTDPVTYTATVETTYKGEATDVLVFTSALFGASCGLEGMEEGERYAFFLQRVGARSRWLRGEPGDLVGSLCGGTRRAGDAVDRRLDDLAEPVPAPLPGAGPGAAGPASQHTDVAEGPSPSVDQAGSLAWVPWALGGLAAAAATAAGAWLRRRRWG